MYPVFDWIIFYRCMNDVRPSMRFLSLSKETLKTSAIKFLVRDLKGQPLWFDMVYLSEHDLHDLRMIMITYFP